MSTITNHQMLRVIYSAALLRPLLSNPGHAKAIAFIRDRDGYCGGVSCNKCPFYVRGNIPSLSGHWCLASMVPQGPVQERVCICTTAGISWHYWRNDEP